MWWSILKKPYIIETDEEYGKDWSWRFNRLFQGSQGDEDTGYWTPQLTEALVYAFLGSHTGKTKDVAKPMIKQTIPTKENKFLDYDNEYGITSRKRDTTPRGRLGYFDGDVEYKYLPDSRVKELAEQTLENLIEELEGGYEISYDEEEAIKNSAGVSFEEAKIHFEHMLNKYF